MATVQNMTIFASIFYLRDVFSATTSVIGLFSSLGSIAYFAGCFLLKPLQKKIPERISLFISSTGMGTFVLCLLFAEKLRNVFFFYGCLFIILALFWPSLMGWLSSGSEGSLLGKRLSRFNIAWTLGAFTGPFAAGYLVEKDVGLPLIIAAMGFFLLGFGILFGTYKSIQTNDSFEAPTTLQGDPGKGMRYACWIGLFGCYILYGILIAVLPIYLRDNLGFRESFSGILLFLRGIFSVVIFYFLGRFSGWHYKKRQMIWTHVGITVMAFLFIFFHQMWVFILLTSTYGVLFSISYANSLFHGVAGSENRSGRMAVHEGVLTAGMVAGASVSGFLLQTFGVQTVFLFAGGALILVVIAQLFLTGNQGNDAKTFFPL